MKCTCGDPSCKVGRQKKALQDRLNALIQENSRLTEALRLEEEKSQKYWYELDAYKRDED